MAAVVVLVVVLRMGWISDDAFIAIRSVDHLVHGHGLTVNLDERVQSFTSPLWALVCIPFFWITRDPYAALMLPALCLAGVLVVVVAWGGRRQPLWGAIALLTLASSSSFAEFSTSGLENPLAHVLAALFVGERLANHDRPTRLCFLLAGGLSLTRFDDVLLTLPVLAHALMVNRRAALRSAWPAMAVVGAWLLVATFYYGFPLPNTAYAKLNTAIPAGQKIAQGISYLVDSIYRDPIVAIVFGAGAFVVTRRQTTLAARLLLSGVGLYLLYVVAIGGDFMSGRFLTTSYVVCVLVVASQIAFLPRVPLVAAFGLAVMVLGSFSDRRAERTQTDCVVPRSGVVDERECYVEQTGLVANIREEKWRTHGYLRDFEEHVGRSPEHVVVHDLVGLASYANSAEKHVVERFALTEPLLARIRIAPGPGWRIGHFFREIPAGYLETLRSGQNTIADPCLHALYDELSPVIHGPLWKWSRLAHIVRLNWGRSTCPSP
ncbi:MAG TPA: hypothetical protein VHO06_17415 [Polyangia bacterium]|nr:hypothetical protein [Polyangia bacterium]